VKLVSPSRRRAVDMLYERPGINGHPTMMSQPRRHGQHPRHHPPRQQHRPVTTCTSPAAQVSREPHAAKTH
jgi:hypothetical protein